PSTSLVFVLWCACCRGPGLLHHWRYFSTAKNIIIPTSRFSSGRPHRWASDCATGFSLRHNHAGSPAKETTMTLPYHLKRAMLVLAMLPAVASAQNYPEKPLRFIVPYPAGGPTDVVSRVVSEALAKKLGQP